MSEVAAVIPTFRPEAADLLSLITALTAEGVHVTVSDDASPCTVDASMRTAATLGAHVVRHHANAGIARGLNDGLRAAAREGRRWLITIDQDSALPPGYVAALLEVATSACATLGEDAIGAVAAGRIADASGDLGYPLTVLDGFMTTAEVIQTGTLWSVDGLLAIGGFDETFGIDGVDAAACVRLRSQGRRIVVAPDLAVGHRIGEGKQVTMLGRSVMATGHSPERRTTIVRNRLRLAPEELRESPLQAVRSLRRVAVGTVLAVTVEDNRWAKAKASLRGLLPRRDR